jgi:hypothetical protein
MRVVLAAVLSLAVSCAHRPCVMSDDDRAWIDEAVTSWQRIATEDLALARPERPRILMSDDRCLWDVRSHIRPGRLHNGRIELPGGTVVTPDLVATTTPYEAGGEWAAYFHIAALRMWREHPVAGKDPHLRDRMLSAMIHELTHTLQLPLYTPALLAAKDAAGIEASIDDDYIEKRFSSDAAYTEAFGRERAALEAAWKTKAPAARRAHLEAALRLAGERRAKLGPHLAKLDAMFLLVEGVAEWARLQYLRDTMQDRTDEEILDIMRGRKNAWSQDEGILVVLLLDELGYDWKPAAFKAEVPDPFVMLRDALQRQ